MHGATGASATERHTEDNDFVQAGDLYRLMGEEEKKRLVDNIAGGLAQVSRDDILERSLGHFRAADPDYGKRVAAAVQAGRAVRTSPGHAPIDSQRGRPKPGRNPPRACGNAADLRPGVAMPNASRSENFFSAICHRSRYVWNENQTTSRSPSATPALRYTAGNCTAPESRSAAAGQAPRRQGQGLRAMNRRASS